MYRQKQPYGLLHPTVLREMAWKVYNRIGQGMERAKMQGMIKAQHYIGGTYSMELVVLCFCRPCCNIMINVNGFLSSRSISISRTLFLVSIFSVEHLSHQSAFFPSFLFRLNALDCGNRGNLSPGWLLHITVKVHLVAGYIPTP